MFIQRTVFSPLSLDVHDTERARGKPLFVRDSPADSSAVQNTLLSEIRRSALAVISDSTYVSYSSGYVSGAGSQRGRRLIVRSAQSSHQDPAGTVRLPGRARSGS